MKRSEEFDAGIYQWEWRDDKIAIARWDEPPSSTNQWVRVNSGKRYFLEGTSNDDIRVVVLLERRKKLKETP